jgi:hypothetical protein
MADIKQRRDLGQLKTENAISLRYWPRLPSLGFSSILLESFGVLPL